MNTYSSAIHNIRHSFKQTPYKLIFGMLATYFISGCSSNLAKTSNQYYHAPAQAYNLFLGNAAITGKPTLRESCSENGSSLEIVDATGNFFRIDVINLLSHPGLTTSNKTQSAQVISQYFYNLYQIPASNTQVFSTRTNDKQLYLSFPIEKQTSSADGNIKPVLGMLVSQYDNLLFSVQHVQTSYNRQQMLNKLNAIQSAMSIPGRFIKKTPKKLQDADGKDLPENLGFMMIDPTQATPDEVKKWRENARC